VVGVVRQKNMVIDPETKNGCAGRRKQHITAKLSVVMKRSTPPFVEDETLKCLEQKYGYGPRYQE
jgi:hypothetical protein